MGVRLCWVLLCCFLLGEMDLARAAEEPPEQLYESAFREIVEGNYGEAYDRLDRVIREYPDTPYARLAAERRARLERLDLPAIRRKHLDQSGRTDSVVFSTLYATWLGVGTARLLDEADGEKAVAAGMMIGAPLGLLTSLAITRDATLTDGQAALINFSGYWGTWQGLGWTLLSSDRDDEKTLILGAMAGGLFGLATTSILTRQIDLTTGDAGLINYGALWGTWLSFCAAGFAEVDDGDSILALLLSGGNLGAAAMAMMAPITDMSLARASLINVGGVVGTIVAAGALLILQPDNAQVGFGTLAVGGITGLAVGTSTTRQFDREPRVRQASRPWPARLPLLDMRSAHLLPVSSAGNPDEIRTHFLAVRF